MHPRKQQRAPHCRAADDVAAAPAVVVVFVAIGARVGFPLAVNIIAGFLEAQCEGAQAGVHRGEADAQPAVEAQICGGFEGDDEARDGGAGANPASAARSTAAGTSSAPAAPCAGRSAAATCCGGGHI